MYLLGWADYLTNQLSTTGDGSSDQFGVQFDDLTAV